jgi:hypothetical protein
MCEKAMRVAKGRGKRAESPIVVTQDHSVTASCSSRACSVLPHLHQGPSKPEATNNSEELLVDNPAPIDPKCVTLSERTCVVEDGRNTSFDGERMFEMGAFRVCPC